MKIRVKERNNEGKKESFIRFSNSFRANCLYSIQLTNIDIFRAEKKKKKKKKSNVYI